MREYYGYVYMIIDREYDKIYIGQKKGSIEDSKDYFGSGTIIRRIIKKRGTDLLEKEILGIRYNKKELLNFETECKNKYNAFDPNVGYNISVRDNGGDNFTYHPNKEEYRKKLSTACKGEKNGFFAKKHSTESLEKMSKAHKGKVFSEKIRKMWSETRKGRKHSKESKEKMSKALKGKPSKLKGRTYEEIHGTEKAKELKEKIKQAKLYTKLSENTKRKISEAHKKENLSQESRKRMSISQRNKKPTKWINKNDIEKMVLSGHLQVYLNGGYVLGRSYKEVIEENNNEIS